MPIAQAVRLICDEAGLSVLYSASLDAKAVTLEVRGQPAEEVLAMIARQHNAELRRAGGLFFMGDLRPEDRAVMVRRVKRLKAEEIEQVCAVYASDSGRRAVTADGLVVVGDTVEVCTRIGEVVDQVEASPVPMWVVQLHLVAVSEEAAREIGVETTPSAVFAATMAASQGASSVFSTAAVSLRAALSLSDESSDVQRVAEPMFLVADGGEVRWQSGERIPVPRRSTSDQGTTTTEAFEMVDTGTILAVKLREVSSEAARVDLSYEDSQIVGFVESAPRTARDSFTAAVILRQQEPYLVGVIKLREARTDAARGLSWLDSSRETGRQVQVWARVYRVSAGLVEQGIEEKAQEKAELPSAETDLG
jgi:type II secretory pathway component GspD/PulD (secretin)